MSAVFFLFLHSCRWGGAECRSLWKTNDVSHSRFELRKSAWGHTCAETVMNILPPATCLLISLEKGIHCMDCLILYLQYHWLVVFFNRITLNRTLQYSFPLKLITSLETWTYSCIVNWWAPAVLLINYFSCVVVEFGSKWTSVSSSLSSAVTWKPALCHVPE